MKQVQNVPELSYRGKELIEFLNVCVDHVEDYTVPQYGDYPHDQVTNWNERDFVKEIQKYANRLESNMRGPEEAERDLKKITHYCALLYHYRRRTKE